MIEKEINGEGGRVGTGIHRPNWRGTCLNKVHSIHWAEYSVPFENDVYRGFVITREDAYSEKNAVCRRKQQNCMFSTNTPGEKPSQTKPTNRRKRPKGQPTPTPAAAGDLLGWQT